MRNQCETATGGSVSARNEPKYCCDGSDPDDIVISGMSGRFPLSDNIEELSEGLYSKKPFIVPSEDRWEKGALGITYTDAGLLKDLERFDAEFFRVPSCIARNIEPDQRILMEVCYEAIADAGYDPEVLKGKNVSVYCASSNGDAREIYSRGLEFDPYSGIGYLLCLRANRCSYVMDLRGRSFNVDSACSSSAVAFDIAVNDLQHGRCDAAVVSGSQVILNPEVNAGYIIAGILTKKGHCCPFDSSADGMSRTEGVAAVFLQKASSARRVYAKVMCSEVASAGYVPEGIYVPSVTAEVSLFKSTFGKCKVNPAEIDYVEAHGTGTAVGDPVEINAISEFFCKNRRKPLLVGTVKSNIGHSEASAGLCGIVKSILAFETGLIAPNLNYRTPNPACSALLDGRVQIVTDTVPLTSSCIAVNCFGFGGAIAQIILKRNEYEGDKTQKKCLPQLALYSASTKNGVQYGLDYLMRIQPRREFFALLHNLAPSSPKYKPFRGFALLNDKPVTEVQKVEQGRQVWYIVTGMGCQWPGMACDLMELDVFANSMHRSAETLKPFGIDLLELLQPNKDHLLRNKRISPAFVAICAIQIALVDVLNELGIVPDGIIGHSTGEMVCAYADGCCTAEQTILSAYWRGKAVEEAGLVDGAMAAIGLTWEETKRQCPANVYAACHNAQDSVTISGLTEPVEKFVAELARENVFARVVNAYGYGFHSCLVHGAAPSLKVGLEKIFADPKPRSKRWYSTSYAPEEWSKPEAQTADAAYFVHNLMSNVHFAEALAYVPSDAITIEIGPHFLLQSILKRGIGRNASYIGLMKRNENNMNYLLSSIGKLYILGLNPQIENLYPAMKYPVPRGTPVLSSMIKWNHETTWKVTKWTKGSRGIEKFLVKTSGSDAYLMDHCIDGRSLYPATGYVVIVWEALAKMMDKSMEDIPIIIEDFKIHRPIILSATDSKILSVSFLNVVGTFEVVEGGSVVATGQISSPPKLTLSSPEEIERDRLKMINGQEMYNELKIHGYEYGPAFQCLDEVDIDGTHGFIKWPGKWIPFLDAHLLFFGLLDKSEQFCLPTGALSVKIDPSQLKSYIELMEAKGQRSVPVSHEKYTRVCRSPGVEIEKLKLEPAPRRTVTENLPLLEKCSFVPYGEICCIRDGAKEKFQEYIDICAQVANELALSIDKAAPKLVKSTVNATFDEKLKDYLDSSNGEHVLLSLLQKISKTTSKDKFLDVVKESFSSYLAEVGKDLLYGTLIQEHSLRYILEIISENTQGRLTAVEVSNGHPPILPTAVDTMKTFTRFKLKGTFAHPDPKAVDQEPFTQRNIDVASTNSLKNVKGQDIVISSFLFGDINSFQNHVKSLVAMARDGSFVLLLHRANVIPAEAFLCSLYDKQLQILSEASIEDVFRKENLNVVSKVTDGLGSSLYLLRYNLRSVSQYNNTVINIKDGCYSEWIETLKDALNAACDDDCARIWLVADDSQYNGIIGMVKCLKYEPGGEKARCVFIMKDKKSAQMPEFDLDNPGYSEVLCKDLLMNIYCDGTWGSFRHSTVDLNSNVRKVKHSFLNCTKYGDLSSFKWIESPYKYDMDINGRSEALIHVVYAALNFKDVMLATAKINAGAAREELGNDPCVLGLEFSGVLPDGRRVMGAMSNRAMATTIHRRPLFMVDVPDHWSLEDAATIPVVYGTCYYALIIRGQLAKGQSVLIHSGTGGIGTAAIRIALSLDCEIFTTVGTKEKRECLKKLFPQIKDENIGCSRDTSFEYMVQKGTKGRGVEVVLNSLADDKLQASTRCLAASGKFIEIGKYDLQLDHKIGLGMFLENTSFHAVFLDKISHFAPDQEGPRIHELLREGLRKGVVQPLTRTVFPSNDVEKAFRYMGSGRHVGKVLLKIRDEPKRGTAPPPLEIASLPCTYLYKYKTYIIIGGLGGFGIELAKWLVEKGARHIFLTSRYGVKSAYHRLCLQRWQRMGIDVTVSTLNVAKKDEAKQLLQEVSKIGPVGGIFNSAVVLKDAFMENQCPEYFEEACAPKAAATKYLDEFTRTLCPFLDVFVCFSSISCGKGNAGQTNYGYANSVMERVCEKRRKDGLHGLAVQWGIIGDVGIVHRQMGEDAMIAGVMAQKIRSCLETLDKFLQQDEPVMSSYVNADALRKRANPDDILTQLAKILGHKDPSEMNMTRSFQEIGIDSMVGVEIQQILESNYDITLTVKELQDMKIGDLKNLVEMKGVKKAEAKIQGQGSEQSKRMEQNLMPKVAVIPLNTNTSGTSVFFVHYSEYEIRQLQSLTGQMSNPCFGLLCPKSVPLENINVMAISYLKEICKFTEEGVHLIGYLSASPLALEMAIQSQSGSKELPKILSLTLVDASLQLASAINSSPDFVFNDEQEIVELEKFLNQFSEETGAMGAMHYEYLKQYGYERQKKIGDLLGPMWHGELNNVEATQAARRYLQIQALLQKYHPQTKYQGDILVLEATGKLLPNDVSVVKSAISKVCQGKVAIQRLPGGENFFSEPVTAAKSAAVLNEIYQSNLS